MIKFFVAGLVMGIAGFYAAVYFVPVVDQHREVSLITVSPNGGNAETFHINMPGDRVIPGENDPGGSSAVQWPVAPMLANTDVDLYKLRNSRDAVVGVASRLTQQDGATGGAVEWVLHLPARGSMYFTLDPLIKDKRRVGEVRAGTREFGNIVGTVSERWVEDADGLDELSTGRIELVATTIAAAATIAASEPEGLE